MHARLVIAKHTIGIKILSVGTECKGFVIASLFKAGHGRCEDY